MAIHNKRAFERSEFIRGRKGYLEEKKGRF